MRERARIAFRSGEEAVSFSGYYHNLLQELDREFGVKIKFTGEFLIIYSSNSFPPDLEIFLKDLVELKRRKDILLTKEEIRTAVQYIKQGEYNKLRGTFSEIILISPKGKRIKPKTPGQRKYIELIRKKDMVFCIGPAGSGKTYLAVASALSYFLEKRVDRIILTKPVVEAGEKLGFLPGTFLEKVDPHFRPLYDALYDFMSVERVNRLIENNIIEIAPLAYMRGRTLNDSFIILDEGQNTTNSQMKMFLTRLGFNSKVVITGDITQMDIPNPRDSGLITAINILSEIEGVGIVKLEKEDIVRHSLVQKIVEAYEKIEEKKNKS
ncbi:MAG: hypothetical protein DRI28_02075 [Caldiserica bacterium]|nr:MAG: hypothetical protein DRI28_02075 [Caldisericota bacterium]